MSYRTFKHLLGETSLERKCRFLFGGGILFLITLSFTFYGRRTEQLVLDQRTEVARKLVEAWGVVKPHLKALGKLETNIINEVIGDRSPLVARTENEVRVIDPRQPQQAEGGPLDDFTAGSVARLLESARRSKGLPPPEDRKAYTFPDGSPNEYSRSSPGRREYLYVQGVLFQPRCMGCHATMPAETASGKFAPPEPNDLAMIVSVKLPTDRTNKELHTNRAILISTAMVTVLLAMLSFHVIVRYVIARPVKHLRDVSDAIAAGRLNIRSQIHTGDEFEELSHAFNRMLHNLVAMQQELREVNADLDKKVDELAQANLALFEMNRLKSDFLATMSHELRTPLNSIIGFSEVLAENAELAERQRRYAQNIQSSGKMLLGMINDILDLAKIESGKMEVRVEDFSIRDVCEGLVNLMRPMADRKDIALESRLDEAIPLLRQDPGKIRQIIYNLLSNAIKFTPEGGRVTLTTRAEGRHVVVEVADTGIGIAEEDRDRIFEKFRQVGAGGPDGSVLTREHQGTGLGLSIVRELTRLLGGEIQLESRLGQGSTFRVRVPLQLMGSRRFEVRLADERIDLTKARRVEPWAGLPHIAPPGPAPARRPVAEAPPAEGAR